MHVIKEPAVREADVKTGDDGLRHDLGHGNLRWRHYLTSKSLTLMLHLITTVHPNQSWSLELKRRRGFMSRP